MILLIRSSKPVYLTDEKARELTARFIQDPSKKVWGHKAIRAALLEMSHGKCCYCEVLVDVAGADMEVEHFRHKHKYKELVVDWDNLLPSCSSCNGSKSAHDVEAEPIINPCNDDPREHLYMYCYAMRGKTELGKTTIDVVDLNNFKKLAARLQSAKVISGELSDMESRLVEMRAGDARVGRGIVKRMINLLALAQPDSPFSATIATVLLGDALYESVRSLMAEKGLWRDDIEGLEGTARSIALLR